MLITLPVIEVKSLNGPHRIHLTFDQTSQIQTATSPVLLTTELLLISVTRKLEKILFSAENLQQEGLAQRLQDQGPQEIGPEVSTGGTRANHGAGPPQAMLSRSGCQVT
jgi:hypothetical protein